MHRFGGKHLENGSRRFDDRYRQDAPAHLYTYCLDVCKKPSLGAWERDGQSLVV